MTLKTVGIISPGDMGHSVGNVLVEHGLKVIACLNDRSIRTRKLAAQAGIQESSSYAELVRDADIVLSILVSAEAINIAETIAETLKETGERVTYVDCNAVAPQTVIKIGKTILEAGSKFVDAGIIGPPPGGEVIPRIYASGPDTVEFAELKDYGLDVRVIGTEIGQASGLKMTFAALTKGTSALSLELLVAAQRMGLYDALARELQESQQHTYKSLSGSLGRIPYKSRRWVAEMEEIAKTFGNLGLTSKIFEGAADMYRFVGANRLADETPENYDKNRSLEQLIKLLAEE